ncbi:MAG: YbaB/EbfC family nucleoid-associated protein, partial [Verrucomicrobia bacterium]|nr:YbaB/EbfC family nucleoid-associated protein [Cytophagales bacterium]
AQENLVHITATAEAGAGMVKATVNGLRQVISLEIDDSLLNPQDKEVLQDLVVAATNKAITEVEEKSREELQKATQGIMPDMPGFNFNDLIQGG